MAFTQYLLVGLGILLVFDLVLLALVLRLRAHYLSLTKGVSQKNLMAVLEGIQKTLATHERHLAVTKKELSQVVSDGKLHLSQVRLKRFNPFADTGGDQSFILAIMDSHKDGVVITSLHSRENTRFYVKSVKGGVGTKHPLSSEEQKLIK